ncbi:MAG: hypothetical protein AAF936_03300 [Pseudomonadota bacterium]
MTALLATSIETTVFEAELQAARRGSTPWQLPESDGSPASKSNTGFHAGVSKAFTAVYNALKYQQS